MNLNCRILGSVERLWEEGTIILINYIFFLECRDAECVCLVIHFYRLNVIGVIHDFFYSLLQITKENVKEHFR